VTARPVGGQALLAYAFARADGPHAAAGWAHLQALWEACRRQLGMDAEVPGLAPVTLPASAADVPARPGLVAACQRPGDDGVWQAFARREHDAACLAVLLAPGPAGTAGRPGAAPGSWAELEQRWQALQPAGGPPDLLGQAVVLIGLAPAGGAAASAPEPADLSGLVRQAVAGPTTPGWWRHPAATPHPFTLWEASASADDGRPARRVVVLAPEAAEDAAYRWVWTSGDGELAPLGRYLLHAAKLRHQLRVFDDGRSFRRIHAEVEAAIDELLRFHLAADPAAVPVARLLDARARLAGVQAGTAGLVAASTRLREIARTVDIARTNMAALSASTGPPGPSAGLFADDRALAAWFADRLADEQVYLDAARERAREVADVTAAVVDQRLAERQEATRRHQERGTLLQTSVLGALLMALAAVQALGYQLRVVPGAAQAPLIVLLAALALALPSWALRLHPEARDGAPLGAADHVMVGAVGAAAGWLALAWAASLHHWALGPGWALLAAAGGAALTVVTTILVPVARRAS
jgi:hypothetical protein